MSNKITVPGTLPEVFFVARVVLPGETFGPGRQRNDPDPWGATDIVVEFSEVGGKPVAAYLRRTLLDGPVAPLALRYGSARLQISAGGMAAVRRMVQEY